ncbi:MAG: DUF1330 domain-containing protein [Thermoplasmata archaeon]|nr:DUF1330 domain-containing protein [Thermoplasmata archaeon]
MLSPARVWALGMPAYVITEIDWHDEKKANEYRTLFGPALEKFGGKTLAVQGPPVVLDGTWKPSRVVLLEFPTMEAVHAWYNSPEYAPVLALRRDGAKTNRVAIERP